MIFVTVGTQFFDELIGEVDRLAAIGTLDQPVFAQVGLNQRTPQHIDHAPFVDDINKHYRNANLIITHAGTGSLCECIATKKPFIAVANQAKAGNHQLEFLQNLSRICDFCWIPSPADLAAALPHARPATPKNHSSVTRLAQNFRAFCSP